MYNSVPTSLNFKVNLLLVVFLELLIHFGVPTFKHATLKHATLKHGHLNTGQINTRTLKHRSDKHTDI